MPFALIAYPKLAPTDLAWIAAIRLRYTDLAGSQFAPHVTLVFPLRDVESAPLARHVARAIAGWPAVRFVVRGSILVKDASGPDTYIFLVPDEGFSAIVRLHDRLYTELLAPYLRLDIPFIPHITVGYARDAALCKQVVDALNVQDILIRGVLDELVLVDVAAPAAPALARFTLPG